MKEYGPHGADLKLSGGVNDRDSSAKFWLAIAGIEGGRFYAHSLAKRVLGRINHGGSRR